MLESDRHLPIEGPTDEPISPDQNGTPLEGTDPLSLAPPNLKVRARRGRLLRPEDAKGTNFTPEQRLMILDSWRRSGLAAGDFAPSWASTRGRNGSTAKDLPTQLRVGPGICRS